MIAARIEKPFEIMARFIWRKPLIVLTISLLLILVAAWQMTRLRLDPSLESLLPKDHPVIVNIQEIEKMYGNLASLTILLKSDNLHQLTKFADKIAAAIEKNEEIRYVEYKKPLPFFEKNLLLYADLPDVQELYNRLKKKFDYERRQNNPIMLDLGDYEDDPGFKINDLIEKYRNRYTVGSETENSSEYYYRKLEKDGKTLHALVVSIKPLKPATDISYGNKISSEMQALVASLQQTEAEKKIKVEFTGQYLQRPESFSLLGEDFQKVTLVSIIALLATLVIALRGFRAILLIFGALLAGIIWTLGITGVTFGQLNLLTTFLVAILFGLGIDFGIHFFMRYKEERENGREPEDAFFRMYTETGVASTISALTTSVAFFGLTFSGFRAFTEFGYIAGTGILIILIAYLTVFSSILSMIEKKVPMKFRGGLIHLRLPDFLIHNPVQRTVFFIVFTIASLWGIRHLQFNYDFSRLLASDGLPSYQVDREVSDLFNRDFDTPTVILPKNAEQEKRILKLIEARMENKDENFPVRRAVGVSTFIPERQPEKLAVIRKIKNLMDLNKKYSQLLAKEKRVNTRNFEDLLVKKPITISDLPVSIRRNFTGENAQNEKFAILLWHNADLNDGREALRYAAALNSLKLDGQPLKIATEHLIFAGILTIIAEDGPFILLYSLAAVFLLVFIDFRAIHRAVLVLSPVIFGLIWMGGTMGVLGIKVDFINAIMFPIVVGIGIDSGVHLYHRYRESGSVFTAVKNTGEAVLLSSLTTMMGFGALALAHNPTIQGLGHVAIIGIICTVLSALLFLPAKILLGQQWKLGKLDQEGDDPDDELLNTITEDEPSTSVSKKSHKSPAKPKAATSKKSGPVKKPASPNSKSDKLQKPSSTAKSSAKTSVKPKAKKSAKTENQKKKTTAKKKP